MKQMDGTILSHWKQSQMWIIQKQIPFILVWTNQAMWFIIWKNTQWTNKSKKNNQLMYEICQQVDDWTSYDDFAFQSKQLNNEQWIIVNGILYIKFKNPI
jgi:hypothetical protein